MAQNPTLQMRWDTYAKIQVMTCKFYIKGLFTSVLTKYSIIISSPVISVSINKLFTNADSKSGSVS